MKLARVKSLALPRPLHDLQQLCDLPESRCPHWSHEEAAAPVCEGGVTVQGSTRVSPVLLTVNHRHVQGSAHGHSRRVCVSVRDVRECVHLTAAVAWRGLRAGMWDVCALREVCAGERCARGIGGWWGGGVDMAEKAFTGRKPVRKHQRAQAHSAAPTTQTELLEAAVVQGGSQQPRRLPRPSLLSLPSQQSQLGKGPYPPPPSLTWD